MHKSTIEIDRQIRKAEADHGNHLGDMIVRAVVGVSLCFAGLLLRTQAEMPRLAIVCFAAAIWMFFLVISSLRKARSTSSKISELYEERREIIDSLNSRRELIKK